MRTSSEFGVFRDPADPQALLAIRYWQFHSEILVAAISHFAAIARQAIGPDKLIGVFYGYFMDLQRHRTCWPNSGHLALRKLLADLNINFISSPTAYKNREPGRGFAIFNSLTESIALHGKLWWNENDILTPGSPPLKDKLFYKPRDATESRHLQRREFINSLCHGAGQWWFDMWGGYYDDPRVMDDVRKMIQIADRAANMDVSPAAQIAVVLDEESIFHLKADNTLTVPLIADQLIELGHVGAPFSMLHVDDVAQARQHKLYIFLNLFHLDDESLVQQVTRRPGVSSLFVYAPGLIGRGISADGMRRLTGIRLHVERRETPLMVTTAWGRYGLATPIAPVVYAEDDEAEVLGYLNDSNRAALVRSASRDSPWRFTRPHRACRPTCCGSSRARRASTSTAMPARASMPTRPSSASAPIPAGWRHCASRKTTSCMMSWKTAS